MVQNSDPSRKQGDLAGPTDPKQSQDRNPSRDRQGAIHARGAETAPTRLRPCSTVRFAVLEHRDRDGMHYDLLIEDGESLATWKLGRPPENAAQEDLPCTRVADHRRMYLHYEGPISGDRGEVVRHDEGRCIVHARQAHCWELTFEGRLLAGRFALHRLREAGDAWRLRSLPL